MPTDPTAPGGRHDLLGPGPTEPATSAASTVYDDPGVGADPALDAFVEPYVAPEPVPPSQLLHHHVTAVLVAHDGRRWLPRTLAALGGLERRPDRVLAVDTGSRDETARLLDDGLGHRAVVRVGARVGFGAAVAEGLRAADALGRPHDGRTEWIWVLHDDSAPEPAALTRLLEWAVRRPDAGVLGPKVRGWGDERQLLEMGVSITGGGRRHTGLERREFDQGQHDDIADVLAVGSAGMLVRRDVWEELGGFDPALPVFRDDVDLGWRANLAGYRVVLCPDAVVHHAEAAAHGRRRMAAVRRRAHLVDRRHALYVLAVNTPALLLPLVLLRHVLGGLGRAAGFFLGKQPALAGEEVAAVLSVVARPDRLVRARRARRDLRRVPHRDLRALFPPRGQAVRHAGESLLGVVTGTGSGHDLPSSRRRAATPGVDDDEDDEVLDTETALLRALTRPVVLVGAGLTLLTLLAVRSLVGSGRLTGGALLPAQDSVASLWAFYTTSWHGVGLGSPTAAPPYTALVASLAAVLRSPSLAVDVLLLGSVPLAGLTAYLLVRRLVDGAWLRSWAAVSYALLPATTGAVAAGRLGTAVAIVVTPLVVLAAMRTLGTPREPGPFRAAWSTGLLLAVTAAFVPLAWLVALVLSLVAVATAYRTRAAALRLAAALGLAPVVLLPWTLEVLRSPVLLVTEAGSPGPGLSDDRLAGWALLLAHPGGPGAAPAWLAAGLLLVGWLALLGSRTAAVLTAWTVVLTGLGLGLLVSRLPVTGPTLETPVAGWPGYAAALVAGGLVVAAVCGADGIRDRWASGRGGLLRPVLAVVAAGAVGFPLLSGAWWLVRGADDPLDRRDPAVLPAYVAEEAARPERIRTLVLQVADDSRVTYALLRESGPRLGDAETGPPPETYEGLDQVVGDLVSGRGGAEAAELAGFAARYVYLPAPADAGLTDVLDSVEGLVRASAPDGAAMWRVETTVARVRVVDPAADTVVVGAGQVTARDQVPAGGADRELVLADNADSGWSATLDGVELEPLVVDGWAQGYALSESGGSVELTHRGRERAWWLTFQLVAALVAIVLALPGIRREPGAVDDAADVDEDVPAQAAPPDAPVPAARPVAVPEPVGSAPASVPRGPTRSEAGPPGPTTGDAVLTGQGGFVPVPPGTESSPVAGADASAPSASAPRRGRRARRRGGGGR